MKCKYDKITFVVIQNVTYCSLIVSIDDEGDCLETNEFVGKATCNKDDNFDFEIGKRIALAKAENKLYTYVAKHSTKVIENMTNDLKTTESFRDFALEQIKHNTEYLKEERYLNYKKK